VSKTYQPPATPQGKVNASDPDSRNAKTPRGYMQGYNTQGVCNEHQIVVTAELKHGLARLRPPRTDGRGHPGASSPPPG
jgi:hypothetical protein